MINIKLGEINQENVIGSLLKQREMTLTDLDIKTITLESPSNLKDLDKAETILSEVLSRKGKITVVGDYDVDGIISTYCWLYALKQLDADINYILPNREKDGYGISKNVIAKINEINPDLVITCDNGTTAIHNFDEFRSKGGKVIITDHHLPGEELPNVDAFINPHREDDHSKFKDLCGAGVVFKIISGLGFKNLDDLIPLVTIAALCDSMPLIKDNRRIVYEGLKNMKHTSNIGLRLMLLKLGIMENDEVTTYHVNFIIGPRLNAAGRMKDASIALELLLTKDQDRALKIIEELEELNTKRQEITEQGLTSIKAYYDGKEIQSKLLVTYLDETDPSVIGIISSKLVSTYNLPILTLSPSKSDRNKIKGSGRSVEGFHILNELKQYRNFFNSLGGHVGAAGLEMPRENLDKFIETAFKDGTIVERQLKVDGYLHPLNASLGLVKSIQKLAPFGEGNKPPTFLYEGELTALTVKEKVIYLNIDREYDFTAFNNVPELKERLSKALGSSTLARIQRGLSSGLSIKIIYSLRENNYRNKITVTKVVDSLIINGDKI